MMHGFGFGFGGFFGMILIWVLLIVGSIWLIKVLFSGGDTKSSNRIEKVEDPIDILNRRYARGELNREEFELLKSDLVKK